MDKINHHQTASKAAAKHLQNALTLLASLDPAYNGEWDGLTDLRRSLGELTDRATELAERYQKADA